MRFKVFIEAIDNLSWEGIPSMTDEELENRIRIIRNMLNGTMRLDNAKKQEMERYYGQLLTVRYKRQNPRNKSTDSSPIKNNPKLTDTQQVWWAYYRLRPIEETERVLEDMRTAYRNGVFEGKRLTREEADKISWIVKWLKEVIRTKAA